MRILLSAALLFLSAFASAQTMFIERFKLANNDSASINVADVYTAYENANGTIKLVIGYPNSVVDTKTDFDWAIANSCGNLVEVVTNQNGTFKRMAINPQYVYRIYRLSNKTRIQIKNTNQIFETNLSYDATVELFDDCLAAPSPVSLDSVSVGNDSICFFYTDLTFECFSISDTTSTANIYTTNGTTIDLLRFVSVLRSIWFRSSDSLGFIRNEVTTGFDGAYSNVRQDSMSLVKYGISYFNYLSVKNRAIDIVTSGIYNTNSKYYVDTINWKSVVDTVQRHNMLSKGTYFHSDSTKTLGIGQWPSFPDIDYSYRERGLILSPAYDGAYLVWSIDSTHQSGILSINPHGFGIGSYRNSPHYVSNISGSTDDTTTTTVRATAINKKSEYDFFERMEVSDSTNQLYPNYWSVLMSPKHTYNAYASMYMGIGGLNPNYFYDDTIKAFGVRSVYSNSTFDWLRILLPDGGDTTSNNVTWYNDKYRLKNGSPVSTNGVMSFHYWKGNGTGNDPGFITMSALVDSICGYCPAGSGGNGIYGGDGLLPAGGTDVGLDSGSLKLNLRTTAASTVYGIEMIADDATSSNRFLSMRTDNGDSLRIQESAGDFLFITNTDLQINVSDQTRLVHDSLQIADAGIEAKTKIRSIWGSTPTGWLKRFDGDAYTAGAILKSDGTDFTEGDWFSNFASGTQNTASWTVDNSNTNVNAAVVPKGTGALTASIPDAASTGGNSRGNYAVDLQLQRTNASDVASGANSTIPGGRRCTASGDYSFATGFRATASGAGSVCFGGSGSFSVGASATGSNSFAFGTGADATATNAIAFLADASAVSAVGFGRNADKYSMFSTIPVSFLKWGNQLTLGTSTYELTLDGSSLKASIPSGERWQFEIAVFANTAVVGDGTGTANHQYVASYTGVIRNIGGTTSLLGTVDALMSAKSDATISDASFAITADDANDYLKVVFTPPSTAGSSSQYSVGASIKIFPF